MMDVTKMMGEFKMPGVDMESILSSQRKNIEALTAANRLAFEGIQAMMKRQTEILRQTMQEVAEATQGMAGTASPQEKLAKQTALAKEAFERSISNMREMSEMVAKSNSEVFELLNVRFSQVLDELKDVMVKAGEKVGVKK
ncbi:MAG: phasin family protein [Alphaproteobacteria bacterium]|nr:phasin family protein [Alphaproteobacteria bacterium]